MSWLRKLLEWLLARLPKEGSPVEKEVPPEKAQEGPQEAPGGAKTEEVGHGYHPKERGLYDYWNGQEFVTADPMTLRRKLMDVWGDLTGYMAVAFSPSKNAPECEDKALEKIRAVFGVKSYEEGGLTRDHTFDLFNNFMDYLSHEKKSTKPSVTSPTATSAPSEPTSVESPPTQSSSDSGSTGSENSTDRPTPSS